MSKKLTTKKTYARLVRRTDDNLRSILDAQLSESKDRTENCVECAIAHAGSMLQRVEDLINEGKLKQANAVLDMSDKDYREMAIADAAKDVPVGYSKLPKEVADEMMKTAIRAILKGGK